MFLNISEEAINKEFEKIIKGCKNGYKTDYKWNSIILFFQWQEFYKHEIKLWNENKIYKGLPLQSWLYYNRLKYTGKSCDELTTKEILRAFKISGIYKGYSFHSPFYIQQFIKDYNIKSIYDPFGGWGHRLLGAWNIKYIYNDINTNVVNNIKRIVDYFHLYDKTIYNEDSITFIPNEDYDAIFTCPPYHNIEIYTDKGIENLSYNKFLYSWEQVIKNCKGKYFAFIINEKYKNDMLNIVLNKYNSFNEVSLGSNCTLPTYGNKHLEYLLICN